MASPTPNPGDDPVLVDAPPTPTSPVATDPVSTVVKPDKPIMGNIVSLSKDDWSAWTGGKPASGWTGLDPSAADELTSPNQLRPVHASASQKGYNYRRTGMTTTFSPTSSLVDFQNAVWDHLTDCGMDTIAYLPDPENELLMTNVVKSHSRYTIQTAKTLSATQLTLYDKYDKNNDRAAVKYVLSSLTPALMSKIKEKTEDTDSFHVIWLQLIKTIQSTSIERFEDLKAAIKARHPSQYSGENLESLAADFRKDARELTTAGQYDHNLTLTMLKIFLLAGGAGNEDYRFPLRSTKQKLDQALLDIGYKEKSAAQAHMVAEKLTYQDICREAEDTYRTQYDRKEWPPTSNAPDVRAPAATFGNMATAPTDNAPITRAEVMNLIQSQPTAGQDQAKKGNCHKCGKAGHWANKCPDNVTANRKNNSGRGNQNHGSQNNKPQSWRTVPPPPGTGTAKKVKDKTFNWCEKCRRWTTTHTTATHTGQRRNPPAAATPQANLSTLSLDPSVWLFDFPSS
jgi:Zinc knuckle